MKPAVDQKAAKKRIRRFFDEPVAERRAVTRLIDEVAVCADVFVFGGALRDISLLGVPQFSSDVDIVVQVHDPDVFQKILDQHEAKQNKFGGYRVSLGRWKFDMWEVARTWAFSSGAVEAHGPLSLLDTTFFNWDAILYDWQSGSLHHRQGYFSNLSEKYLELVLEDNPNAIGALVRTLRTLSLSEEILAGPRLSRFVVNQMSELTDQDILSFEARSFSRRRLSKQMLTDIRWRSRDWEEGQSVQWLPERQLSFIHDLVN